VPADPRLPRSEPPQPLWQPASEAPHGGPCRQHLFDPYKLAVEMAHRVSARRMQANTFFLAVNIGVLTVFANLVNNKIISGFSGALPSIALLALCFVWWRIVRSDRQHNTGKDAVILELENLLRVAPCRSPTWTTGCRACSGAPYLLLMLAALLGVQGQAAAGS
jgi:hypothetical protein